MRTYRDFEDFLTSKFGESEEGRVILDDDWPEAFDAWLEDLDLDSIIKYADLYATVKQIEAVDRLFKTVRGE